MNPTIYRQHRPEAARADGIPRERMCANGVHCMDLHHDRRARSVVILVLLVARSSRTTGKQGKAEKKRYICSI